MKNKPDKKYGGFSTKTAREARERKEEAYWASLSGEVEKKILSAEAEPPIPRKRCICGPGWHENCKSNPCYALEVGEKKPTREEN